MVWASYYRACCVGWPPRPHPYLRTKYVPFCAQDHKMVDKEVEFSTLNLQCSSVMNITNSLILCLM